jgi:hypothetical protein
MRFVGLLLSQTLNFDRLNIIHDIHTIESLLLNLRFIPR